jgi:16S rRNA (uracil1498-N3)-methyltransferase
MFLFYTNDVLSEGFWLHDDEHTHCTKVLRHQLGDNINATDGKGTLYHGSISSINKTETFVNINKREFVEIAAQKVCIAISPTKTPARLEWFVEKAVEIGIEEIIIFVGQRTEKKSTNITRIEKIALTSMKQSLRTWLPKITTCENLKSLINASKSYDQKYIAHLEDDTKPLKSIYHNTESSIVLIGPEGDFTPSEIKLCLENNFKGVDLGDMRLRTETAGLVALMIMRL